MGDERLSFLTELVSGSGRVRESRRGNECRTVLKRRWCNTRASSRDFWKASVSGSSEVCVDVAPVQGVRTARPGLVEAESESDCRRSVSSPGALTDGGVLGVEELARAGASRRMQVLMAGDGGRYFSSPGAFVRDAGVLVVEELGQVVVDSGCPGPVKRGC